MTRTTLGWLVVVPGLVVAACGVEDPGVDTAVQDVAGPRPDYVVASLGDPPAAAVTGAAFTVTTVVQNVGTADAVASSRTRYFLSLDQTFGGDAAVVQSAVVPPLAIGATDSQGITLRIPDVAASSYFVIACADKTNMVPELDNTNNCRASATQVAVTGPDLRVTVVGNPPALLATGDTFSITDTVGNIGTAAAATSAVGYYLSVSTVKGPDAYKLVPRRKTGPIAAGATSSGTVNATVPAVAPGAYHVIACADVGKVVFETSEANNCTASAGTAAIGLGGAVITGVATTDGFTQIRQGADAQLVITGIGLDTTTAVALGEIGATLVSATPTEVRADVSIAHGTAPGPRTLTLTNADGTVARPDAIELTPFVVSPAGTDDGLGTYQSTLALCAQALEDNAWYGDTVHLTAGEHVCTGGVELRGPVAVTGEGIDTTIVTGSFYLTHSATTVGNMTLVSPGAALQIYGSGPWAVEDLKVIGGGIAIGTSDLAVRLAITDYQATGTGPGLEIDGSGGITATVANSQFTGAGIGISHASYGALTVTDTSFTGCTTGVYVSRGSATLDAVTIDSCNIGIRLASAALGDSATVTVDQSTLVDNTIGAYVGGGGTLTLNDSAIRDDETTARASTTGVWIQDGVLEMEGGVISDQDQAGIEAYTGGDVNLDMTLTGVTIERGARGIYAHGSPDCASIWMTSSVIRDQTAAAVSWGINRSCNIEIGGNQLSVVSGYALDDVRDDAPPFWSEINAVGTTLNGNTYTGAVSGPADVPPDYRIIGFDDGEDPYVIHF